MSILLISVLLPVAEVLGENTCSVHGVNYSYRPYGAINSVEVFPVVWDVRSAGEAFSSYLRDYVIESSWDPVADLLTEASYSGFNAVMVRQGLGLDAGDRHGETDGFEHVANTARSMGMDVIAGGFFTSPYANQYNMSVLDYLEDYITGTAGVYPGDVIGIFGFDEPEVKFLENPGSAYDWIRMISRYSGLCSERIDLPFSSFICRFGDYSGPGWTYFSDTTCVLNRFSRYLDAVIFDNYPVTNNTRRDRTFPMDISEVIHLGSTDLLPSDGSFYRSFCDADELFTVTSDSSGCKFLVYQFGYSPGFQSLEMFPACSLQLPYEPEFMASSDFRTCDIGDRTSGSHMQNGAVVLWDSLANPGSAVVVIPGLEGLEITGLPEFQSSDAARTLFYAVGDGGSGSPWPVRTPGLLGRGMTVICGCYRFPDGNTGLVVFVRTADGFRLETPEPLGMHLTNPAGILWGRFWGPPGPGGQDASSSPQGFVIYDTSGRYHTCRLSSEGWYVAPTDPAVFNGLFGGMVDPISVFVSREDQNLPMYYPGYDHVSSVAGENRVYLYRTRSESGEDALLDINSSVINDLQGDLLSAGAFRPDGRYADVLLCATTSGVSKSSGTMTGAETSGELTMIEVLSSTGSLVLPGLRAMDTRRSYRAGLLVGNGELCMPGAELYGDEYDMIRFEWYSQCFEVAMEMGVETTSNRNCLLANVQAFGRHAFSLPLYSASLDTLLFLATEPVIKGCRGLVFYAMDVALQSGGTMEDGSLRYPWLLQNWGPSRDTEDVDMVDRIHQVVAMLTGNTPVDGPDFLAATVDSSYIALDADCVQNCDIQGSWSTPAPDDTLLNFLALESLEDGTVLVMATNESRIPVPSGRGIGFPGRLSVDYSVRTVAGHAPVAGCSQHRGSDVDSDGFLVLDMGGMPPLGVSLLELCPRLEGSVWDDSTFLIVNCFSGSASIRFKTVGTVPSSLCLYDIAGRLVETVWSGTSVPGVMEVSFDTGTYPSGVYFLVLVSEDHPLRGRMTLFSR